MSDLPDFWANRYVNVVAQDLGELINRPKYGGALRIGGTISVLADEDKVLATDTGKGILYGGHIKTAPGVDHAGDILKLYIDGTLIEYIGWDNLYDWQIIIPRMGGFFLTKYDLTNHEYTVGIDAGITYESSWTIKYEEEQSLAIDVYVDLLYAKV